MVRHDRLPQDGGINTLVPSDAGQVEVPNCLFCEIVTGRRPATIRYADDRVLALVPTEQMARVHLLIVPRKHIASIDSMSREDRDLWWHLLDVARRMARQEGINIEREGYHLLANAGRHQQRAFPHPHIHLRSGACE